jgi:hypothetical protein
VGRLWLFFMPLLAIPAAAHLAEWLPGRRLILLAVGLQVAIAVSLGLAWQSVRPVIVVAQRPGMPQQATPSTTLTVGFSETIGQSTTINLVGADLPPEMAVPGNQLPLTLYWQAERGTIRPYTVFTQLLAADGMLVAQQDNWPVNGQWPPTCWQPGEIVLDNYQITLPHDLPNGTYTLIAGLYDARNGQRVPATTGGDYITLQQVTITDGN